MGVREKADFAQRNLGGLSPEIFLKFKRLGAPENQAAAPRGGRDAASERADAHTHADNSYRKRGMHTWAMAV